VTDETCGSEGKIITDFKQLLDTFVCNKVTHGSTMIRSYNDTTLEGNTDGAGSSFQDALLL
jgi:hypothetical protein